VSTANPERIASLGLAKLWDWLHHPLHLRIVLTSAVLLGWYFGIHSTLSDAIDQTSRRVERTRKRVALAHEIESLREQVKSFQDRLPEKTDANEWVAYILAGVRRWPLKLNLLDTEATKDVGPYKAMVLRLDLEGSYQDLNAFLQWIESNHRLLRIDVVRIEPKRSGLGAQLTILGVMG
jgi:Tfp pilus assembly protein PilO